MTRHLFLFLLLAGAATAAKLPSIRQGRTNYNDPLPDILGSYLPPPITTKECPPIYVTFTVTTVETSTYIREGGTVTNTATSTQLIPSLVTSTTYSVITGTITVESTYSRFVTDTTTVTSTRHIPGPIITVTSTNVIYSTDIDYVTQTSTDYDTRTRYVTTTNVRTDFITTTLTDVITNYVTRTIPSRIPGETIYRTITSTDVIATTRITPGRTHTVITTSIIPVYRTETIRLPGITLTVTSLVPTQITTTMYDTDYVDRTRYITSTQRDTVTSTARVYITNTDIVTVPVTRTSIDTVYSTQTSTSHIESVITRSSGITTTTRIPGDTHYVTRTSTRLTTVGYGFRTVESTVSRTVTETDYRTITVTRGGSTSTITIESTKPCEKTGYNYNKPSVAFTHGF